MGCSTHSVPSWSKVAMRSSWATNVGLDLSVVFCMKSTIACLVGPSFQDGSGSLCARATAVKKRTVVAKARTSLRSLSLENLMGPFGLVQFTEFHYNRSALTTAIGLSGKTEKCRSIRESAPWVLRV